MTNKQLFEAFGGVKEKYLAEMLDDEPQRALELRPVKRSPVKKAVIAVTACAAAVGITFGGLALGGKIDLPVLFGGPHGIVKGNPIVSRSCNVNLENFIIEDDFLKGYPDEYAITLRGSADHDYNTVTVNMKLSFSEWDLLDKDDKDTVVAIVRFFADGEKLNYLPIGKSMYSYYPDPLAKYIDPDEVFKREDLNHGELGFYSLNKAKADNADDGCEEKFFEFPVTFDVKKGTSQITVMVEYTPFSVEYPDHIVYAEKKEMRALDDIITQTFPIGAMIESACENDHDSHIVTGWFGHLYGRFETEKGSGNDDDEILNIFSDDRTLKINTSNIDTGKTPYYLMVFSDGEPIECFDGKISKLIDPADHDNGTLIEIPKKFVIPDGIKRELRLMAIPVVDDECSGGMYALPASKRHLLWVKQAADPEFDPE